MGVLPTEASRLRERPRKATPTGAESSPSQRDGRAQDTVAGHTGSPEMILPDTEHKADDHDDYDDEDDDHDTQPGEEAEQGVYSL